jgi:hypothetical protein
LVVIVASHPANAEDLRGLDCFRAKMRQELVHLNTTINYLIDLRDEIAGCLEAEAKEEAKP